MGQVLTANLLRAGEVVYWHGAKGWVSYLNEAEVLDGPDAETALKGADADIESRKIVAPYLFDVRVTGGFPVPTKKREKIRAAGPTVRPDLGKQAG